MAKDHFAEHPKYGKWDWNFNLLVGKHADLARMQQEYAPVLSAQPGLYDPIPAPSTAHIKPARFSDPTLGVLRQWPTQDGHYEWDVVRTLPIGGTA